jgi:small-conductance mechanosensitive channel
MAMAPSMTDVGDCIIVTKAENEIDMCETPGNAWIVEDMSLFCTQLRRPSTREVATIRNATLSKSRIVNFRKSGQARVEIPLKFTINSPHKKIRLFRKVILRYVEDRPQEFFCCIDFRLTRVDSELGYLQYSIVLQTIDSWQDMDLVLDSKMKAARFFVEVQKKLEISYTRKDGIPSCHERILERESRESVQKNWES